MRKRKNWCSYKDSIKLTKRRKKKSKERIVFNLACSLMPVGVLDKLLSLFCLIIYKADKRKHKEKEKERKRKKHKHKRKHKERKNQNTKGIARRAVWHYYLVKTGYHIERFFLLNNSNLRAELLPLNQRPFFFFS